MAERVAFTATSSSGTPDESLDFNLPHDYLLDDGAEGLMAGKAVSKCRLSKNSKKAAAAEKPE